MTDLHEVICSEFAFLSVFSFRSLHFHELKSYVLFIPVFFPFSSYFCVYFDVTFYPTIQFFSFPCL